MRFLLQQRIHPRLVRACVHNMYMWPLLFCGTERCICHAQARRSRLRCVPHLMLLQQWQGAVRFTAAEG